MTNRSKNRRLRASQSFVSGAALSDSSGRKAVLAQNATLREMSFGRRMKNVCSRKMEFMLALPSKTYRKWAVGKDSMARFSIFFEIGILSLRSAKLNLLLPSQDLLRHEVYTSASASLARRRGFSADSSKDDAICYSWTVCEGGM